MPDAARGAPSVRIRRVARPELTAESNTMDAKKVLLIGLHPDVVDYSRWPGLTAEKLEAGLRRDESVLNVQHRAHRLCGCGEAMGVIVEKTD
jgi:hypothetical protein